VIVSVAKYFIVGALGTVTHLSLLYIAVEYLGFAPIVGSSCAFIWVVIQSYFLNRNWTFRSERRHSSALPRYVTVSTIGFFGNFSMMYILLNIFGLWYMLAQILTAFVIPLMNFLLNRYWTFAHDSLD